MKDDREERIARLTAKRAEDTQAGLARVREVLSGYSLAELADFSQARLAREAKVSRSFLYRHPELLLPIRVAKARLQLNQ